MFRKKIKLNLFDEKKPDEKKIEKNIESSPESTDTVLFSKSVIPILPSVASFLNAEEFNAVSSVSGFFNSFYKKEMTWLNLYRAHFGEVIFLEDYKAQYIAAYIHQQADKYFLTERYNELARHIALYDTKPWTLFYKAVLGREGCITGRKPYLYALDAFRLGDVRAGKFLVEDFNRMLYWNGFLSPEFLDETLGLLNTSNIDGKLNKEICLQYAIMFNATSHAEDKIKFKEQALICFFRMFHVNNENTEHLTVMLIKIFPMLNMISQEVAQSLMEDEILPSKSNILEALRYCYQTYEFIDAQPVLHWVKQQNESVDQSTAVKLSSL